MKAVFIEKPGGKLIIKEVNTPKPGPGEVLIKMAAAPVNPSDIAMLRNAHTDNDLATFIPGLEGSGTVVAAGKWISASFPDRKADCMFIGAQFKRYLGRIHGYLCGKMFPSWQEYNR